MDEKRYDEQAAQLGPELAARVEACREAQAGARALPADEEAWGT